MSCSSGQADSTSSTSNNTIMTVEENTSSQVDVDVDVDVYVEDDEMINEKENEYVSQNAAASAAAISGGVYSLGCMQHPRETYVAYCEACEQAVCPLCSENRHHGHDLVKIQSHIERERAMLADAGQLFADVTETFRNRQVELERLRNYHDTQLRDVNDQIERSFQMIERFLKVRKEKLKEELQETMCRRLEEVTMEYDSNNKLIQELQFNHHAVTTLLQNHSISSLLTARKDVVIKVRSANQSKPRIHPSENDTVDFFPNELDQLFCHINKLGLIAASSVSPAKSTIEASTLKPCQLAKEVELVVTPRDMQGRTFEDTSFLNCVATINSPFEKNYFVEVSEKSNSQIKIKYRLDERGTYDLNVKMYGEHIKGSPFTIKTVEDQEILRKKRNVSSRSTSRSVSARRSLTDDLIYRVGSRGRGHAEFSNPHGITVTHTGKIVVADSNNANIQIFGPGGEFQTRFGLRGRDPGQMQRPIDLVETTNNNFLVADYDNRCIHVFSSDGKYISKFGTNRLNGPKGVTVDSKSRVIVVDNKSCLIYVFKNTGKFLHKFGSRGTLDHQLAGPHYVTVGRNDEIIVTDFHNHCVKAFNIDGTFLFAFGSNGREAGQFTAPTGVTTDAKGNIIVADWGNSRIQIFDSAGKYLDTVNSEADPLYGPQGVAVTSDGNIAVIDTGNHCFKVYKFPTYN